MDAGQVLQALKGLQARNDIDAVKSALLRMSGPSGPVKSHYVSFNAVRHTVTCFLEMKSPMLESEVRELGGCAFGNGVCLEFGLRADSDR